MQPSNDVCRLIEIMAALRTPGSGCPWDLEQTHKTLAPYALEEAYEVVDAIERGDLDDLCDELGDLLLQVVFHARLAEEAGAFNFGNVVEAVTAKMVRRHPDVFATAPKAALSGVDIVWEAMKARRIARDGVPAGDDHGLLGAMPAARERTPEAATRAWEAIKADERKDKKPAAPSLVLGDVPSSLPGLTRAVKLQSKASTVGFDWSNAKLVLDKIREEIGEIEEVLENEPAENKSALAEEIGDLIFAVANLARHAKVDPEAAVRSANAKFERRFAHIEKGLASRGRSPAQSGLDEMEGLWAEAKSSGL